MKKVDYKKIKSLFDPNVWDVSLLQEEYYDECVNSPIKLVTHLYGHNLTKSPITGYIKNKVLQKEIKTFLILAKKSIESNDYSLYEDSKRILDQTGHNIMPVYLNFKKAAVLSGIGSVAKNSLVYNRKFGFQCKFCMYAIEYGEFYNVEKISVDRNQLNLCNGCDDCIVNCPAGAIHETWIDAKKCDDFIGFGNDREISSLKWVWWEHIGKKSGKYSKSEVKSWDTYEYLKNIVWDGEYATRGDGIVTKNGVPIDIKHCRKCQEQPRCSKMPVEQ